MNHLMLARVFVVSTLEQHSLTLSLSLLELSLLSCLRMFAGDKFTVNISAQKYFHNINETMLND